MMTVSYHYGVNERECNYIDVIQCKKDLHWRRSSAYITNSSFDSATFPFGQKT